LRSERGFALVITLVVSALLVAVTVEFIHEVVVDTTLRQNYADAQQASLLAESGVNGAIEKLKFDLAKHSSYCSLLDDWAKPIQLEDEKGSISVTIEDESGKLYLNTMSAGDTFASDVCVRLLNELNLPIDLRDTLVDWTDNNTSPERAGAETPYYKTLHPPYAAKDDKLDTVEELGMVKGFTPKVIETLRPFVTVYPNQPVALTATININTASRELIKALDAKITNAQVDTFLNYRKTTPIKATGELENFFGSAIAIPLYTNTTVLGNVYRIVAQGKVGETTRTIEAIVRPLVQPPTNILYWREY